MKITVLADRYDYIEIVEELKQNWLFKLLTYIGIEEEVLEEWDDPNIVELFFDYNIEVINYPSFGGLLVTFEDEVVGEWGGPDMQLRKDPETGELYYEITIEHWSKQEEEE